MNKLNLVLVVLGVAMWSYILGTLTPAVRNETTIEQDAIRYMVAHDRGCSDIIKVPYSDGVICETHMNSEDDALFVVKLRGAKDDYENR